MKNFRDAVKRKMEKEGWTVERITNNPINLRCERNKQVKLICAWQNGHGHIYKDTLRGLKRVQKETGMPVVVAKLNGANEIIFLWLEKFLKPQNEERAALEFTLIPPRDIGFVSYENGKFIKGGRK